MRNRVLSGVHPRSGRPKTSALDRLIAKVWYWSVRRIEGWSDAKLSVQFIPDAEGQRQVPGFHSKAFARTRTLGTIPTTGGRRHAKRNFDLVALVDAHPDFHGTAEVMHSPFWDLLRANPGDLAAATAMVERVSSVLGLTRIYGEEAFLTWAECERTALLGTCIGIRSDGIDGFEVLLQRALGERLPDLDVLALLGAMYREACLSFRLKEAGVFGDYFTIYLARYCDQPWINPVGNSLEEVARRRVLYGEADFQPGDEVPVGPFVGRSFSALVASNDTEAIKSRRCD